MKLITFAILLTSALVKAKPQNVHNEQYPFPPQFQKPNSQIFASDSTLYLPPESHTAVPYFPMKNLNLPFQYLPPTGTKAPSLYQTPFPMIMSSTIVPNFDDDEEDDDEDNRIKNHLSSPQPPQNYNNRSENPPRPQPNNHKEMRSLPKTVAYRHPIDRADIKFPFQMGTMPTPSNQNPANRRMIISAETSRSDQVQDQVKSASFQGPHFIQSPLGFISSTTEPAIPILRLSNEMDLDGSFSYEALGADQTHYVQHSRMENMGTDNEEQVVEGSYSYVGDNGQTYTVHYVADSNGYRASGDHLPVAPPVPEIIQRAVQFNLAEEAKRPAHLKSWQDDERENNNYNNYIEKERNHHFVLPAPQPLQAPPRNLFTGRTPEAFSYSYKDTFSKPPGQESNNNNNKNTNNNNNNNNNLETAASSQVSVKTVDYKQDKSPVPNQNPNSGSIAPQITFLASQGAHVPSLNTQQQSISRMFTSERSILPQLINYEARLKENDENNKALWRWQYGMNAHNENESTKSSISRSFSEGDDVMINFGDMTSEEYTKMIRSQLESSSNQNNGVDTSRIENNAPKNEILNQEKQYYQETPNNYKNYADSKEVTTFKTVESQSYPQLNQWINQNALANSQQQQQSVNIQQQQQEVHNKQQDQLPNYQLKQNPYLSQPLVTNNPLPYLDTKPTQPSSFPQQQTEQTKEVPQKENQSAAESRDLFRSNHHSNLITRHHFLPPSQTVTKSYDYEDSEIVNEDEGAYYEPRRIKSYNLDTLKVVSSHPQTAKQSTPENYMSNSYTTEESRNNYDFDVKITTPQMPATSTSIQSDLKFTDFIVNDNKDEFKPIINVINKPNQDEENVSTTTTTENSVEEMLENNIFLKNLFRVEKGETKHKNAIHEEPKPKTISSKISAEHKSDKIPKYAHPKSLHDTKIMKKKPVDISQVLNYVAYKNGFESSKMKPRSKTFPDNLHHRGEIYHPEENRNEDRDETLRKQLNQKQQEELRGVIKNYKVLQRNNNMNIMNMDQNEQMRKELNPAVRIMHLQQPSNLPPLGRAGPTIKSYLPPIFV